MFLNLLYGIIIICTIYSLIKSVLVANDLGETFISKIGWFFTGIMYYGMIGFMIIGFSFLILGKMEISYYCSHTNKLQYVKRMEINIESLNQTKPNKLIAVGNDEIVYKTKDSHDIQTIKLKPDNNENILDIKDYNIKDNFYSLLNSNDNVIEVYDIKLKNNKKLIYNSLSINSVGVKCIVKINTSNGISKNFKILYAPAPAGIEIYD